MTTQEQRDQVAAQLEAVAKRLRSGEDVGAAGDLSAMWMACNGQDDADWVRSRYDAGMIADKAIDDIDADIDGWAEDMHSIGWGLMVWVERAQACNIEPDVCTECEGAKLIDGDKCEDCDGTGEGSGFDWRCQYRLAPIPPNAVLHMHREGPDTIEPDRGEP